MGASMGGRRMVAALALVALGGCSAPSTGPDPSDGVLVVTSFYPLAEAARIVGGAHADVQNLTPPGVEPHDLELAPDDLETLERADVIAYVSGGFQPALEDVIAESDARTVDALDGPVLPDPDDENGQDDAVDPHVWLDPERYAEIALVLGSSLAVVDPRNAPTYRANARAFADDLAALDDEFTGGLRTCERRLLVVNHAAFGYLAEAYGLEQVAISGLSPEAGPDADRLADLADLVRREGVTTIFTEELAPPEVAATLAEEAGVGTEVLNPLEGLTPEEVDAGEDYISIMRTNLEALRRGLGCA